MSTHSTPIRRRDFLKAGGAAGLAAAVPAQLAGLRSATGQDTQGLIGDGRRRRILLRGGVVLSLDPRVGDFEKADVLIDQTKIAAIGPNLSAACRSRRERSAIESVPPFRRFPAAQVATPSPRCRAVAASRPPGGSFFGFTRRGTSARTVARTWSSPGSQLSRSSSTSHGPSSENVPSARSFMT